MERLTKVYSAYLSATSDITTLSPIEIRDGFLSIHVDVHNGSLGTPTDAPTGTWQLWISSDNSTYYQLTSSAIVTALAAIAAVGNTRVSEWVTFTNVPGKYLKLKYVRASGGATSAADVHLNS